MSTARYWQPPADPTLRLWWERGAQSEVACELKGVNNDGRQVLDYVRVLAQTRQWTAAEYAAVTAYVFTHGWRARARLAWTLVTGRPPRRSASAGC